ncbi:hypothetical protein L249_1080 [Ophiocordyceps polyrhachis-furcata BCC 54312]|uniref:Uncharacterized protein n=1 Tax=Ophiocordyceps polyrhachis-furcata BCC 54312 TaxID=1330021 RepID=A0A367LEM9_9HYPO|nr:hypothetical protein L249_1080 [Ophiocordyceps polyrhachis-furcata BCC 54312]
MQRIFESDSPSLMEKAYYVGRTVPLNDPTAGIVNASLGESVYNHSFTAPSAGFRLSSSPEYVIEKPLPISQPTTFRFPAHPLHVILTYSNLAVENGHRTAYLFNGSSCALQL